MLRATWFSSSRENSGVLEEDVERGDETFPASARAQGEFNFEVYELACEYAFLQRANCEIAASTVAGHAGVRSARPARAGTTSTASPADPRNPTRAGIRPELQRHRRNGRSRPALSPSSNRRQEPDSSSPRSSAGTGRIPLWTAVTRAVISPTVVTHASGSRRLKLTSIPNDVCNAKPRQRPIHLRS